MPRFINLITALAFSGVLLAVLSATYRTHLRDRTHTPVPNMPLPAQIQTIVTDQRVNSHSIIINAPSGPPRIELQTVDPQSRPASVACSTCHSVRQPKLDRKSSVDLKEFHQGMQFSHGQLGCYACHDPGNADSLRLADGQVVEYRDLMALCSQCHSAQATSFAHGAHGGMNGYWDLSRGPQTKHNCIDCHDPHAPEYPQMIVGFKPRDRFLEGTSHDDHE
jgi:hypothetical protein